MKQQNGFTLIELLVVVAIIAILDAVALPAYQDYVTRGKLTEAKTELSSMHVRLEQYYQDHYKYSGFDCTKVSNAKYFTYDCSALKDDTYTARATGIASQGTGNFVFTVNQLNEKATTGVPSGWTSAASCWVSGRGGC